MPRYPQSPSVRELVQKADQLSNQAKRSQAIALYSQALLLEPDCTYALVKRGMALQEERRLNEAIADYEEAITLDPQFGLAYYGRGWARNWRGDYEGELQDAQTGYRFDQNNPTPYLRRIAAALSGLNRHDEAVKIYTQLIQHNPKDEGTIYNRGMAYLKSKRYQEAIQDFTLALQYDPDWTWALTQRAVAFAELHHYQEALADVNLALQYDPAYSPAEKLRGFILTQMPPPKKGGWKKLFGR
jgi:tetratricopeptide (TPR) repeat protein